MPRVFTIEDLSQEEFDAIEAREETDPDYDPYDVPPSAFQYLKAPEFGGGRGPVHVPVRVEQAGATKAKPSFLERLLSRPKPDRYANWEERVEKMAVALTQALAESGAARAYCRYDGGNDEGFAWFDSCTMKDGSTRDAEHVAAELQKAGVFAGFGGARRPREQLDEIVAAYWAVKLLGRGFGTGPFVMYGAFSVDLETGLVSDDPDPAPIVQNIRLKAE